MKDETLVIIIREDFHEVFNYEIQLEPPGTTHIIQVPPGILSGDYRHMQIEIIRKEVAGP